MRSARTGSISARVRHRCSNRTARAVSSSSRGSWRAIGASSLKPQIEAAWASGRPAAAVVFGENGTDQAAETLGLLVVQIAGQAERVAAGVDELLQRVGALLRVADDGDAGARSDFCNAGP